ncbi:MAG: NADH-quinone oxidoreductase subunit NuoN [Hyphomonadaceae bacterium]|jgi:NADH-quinone oxidoreductase subunit N|nr:NADH-quinone oxidoreductase subunit NuoN [Hyphomonadaceae bacterium]
MTTPVSMTPALLAQQVPFIVPELILALGAMAIVMAGAFMGKRSARVLTWASVVVLVAAGFTAVLTMPQEPQVLFLGSYVADLFGAYAKLVIGCVAAAALLLAVDYLEERNIDRPEYPVLAVLATLGMFIMVSAKDLITLYMGLELQSLALYVLAAYARDDAKSSEAGLKYFVLGALSSGLLLYGCSLVYGFTGSVRFEEIAASKAVADGHVGLVFGMVFILCGLAFKISAAPFHMWTPDVYEGSPTPSTAFFATAPKVAAAILFARVCYDAFGPLLEDWRQIISIMAVLSMGVGALFALQQTNIKRLLAYSSIANMGYALVAIASGPEHGPQALLVFVSIYAITSLGMFGIVLSMRDADGRALENIADLAGLSKTRPLMALAMTMLVFSVMGIPPLAGFFGKFEVVSAAVAGGVLPLAIVLVIASVVSAFYYLRLMKTVWFDAPSATVIGGGNSTTVTLTGVTLVLAALTPLVGLLAAVAAVAGSVFQ